MECILQLVVWDRVWELLSAMFKLTQGLQNTMNYLTAMLMLSFYVPNIVCTFQLKEDIKSDKRRQNNLHEVEIVRSTFM